MLDYDQQVAIPTKSCTWYQEVKLVTIGKGTFMN